MKGKVLIVETQFIIAADLSLIVRKAGYSVAGITSSAEEALELMIADRPELVLTDIRLNGKMSGIDLATELIQRDIPFIYVSGNITRNIFEAAMATRPSGFIEKPFLQKDILKVLSAISPGTGICQEKS